MVFGFSDLDMKFLSVGADFRICFGSKGPSKIPWSSDTEISILVFFQSKTKIHFTPWITEPEAFSPFEIWKG